jgi:ubiquitin carboxyl-terminal hydrolase 34
MCCFKTLKNFEKLNNMVQVILSVAIRTIQTLPDGLEKDKKKDDKKEGKDDEQEKEKMQTNEEEDIDEEPEKWTTEEKEKLLTFVTKVFLMNFPSYMAYKHMVHASLEVTLT